MKIAPAGLQQGMPASLQQARSKPLTTRRQVLPCISYIFVTLWVFKEGRKRKKESNRFSLRSRHHGTPGKDGGVHYRSLHGAHKICTHQEDNEK